MGGWWVGGGWSDKTKVILNSTQFKLKLKLVLSLAIKKCPNLVKGGGVNIFQKYLKLKNVPIWSKGGGLHFELWTI